MTATDLDVNTLFMVTMHVEIMLGLLLFFAWAQNFSKTALAWWGSSHLMRACSIMLFGMHGSIPEWASIDLANAVLFGSFALTWSGARVFDRRTAEPVWCAVGVIIWLLACRLPQFSASIELRALVGSFIVTSYTWLAAYEFWRGRDEALVSRWPAIFMLFAHGALFLLRTPLGAMFHISPASVFSQSAWLELLSVEALLFTISIAFILLAMAKERTEYRHRAAARTDELTGLLNRRGFLEQSASSNRWAMDLRSTAVMLIDLDNFKSINDRFGHAVGDRALQMFAETAVASIPSAGLVGRWGGDEFAVVLYDTAREEAKAAAERMQATFQRLAEEISGHQVNATLSIGMVFSAAGPLDLPALLVQADEALYLAKELGRNRIEVASPETVWKSGPAAAVPEPAPILWRKRKTAA
jgi:diguanylate cyclase (GGDEF)-like protein